MSNTYKFRAWVTINNTLKCIKFSLGECPINFDTIDKPPVYEQFIGLTDRNGKEIYSGDIVRVTFSVRSFASAESLLVKFSRGAFRLGATPMCIFADNSESGALMEVIGNIHENPELLKA